MTVDLRFAGALGPQPGGAVSLLFGAAGVVPPVDPPPPLVGALRASTTAPWSRAATLAPAALAAPWRAATARGEAWVAPWGSAAPLGVRTAVSWHAAVATRLPSVVVPWGNSESRGSQTVAPWAQGQPRRQEVRAPWRMAAAGNGRIGSGWRTGKHTVAATRTPWAGGRLVQVLVGASAQDGRATGARTDAPWQTGRMVESIGGPWTPTPATPLAPVPCYLPDPGDAVSLLLREALTGLAALVFACRRAAIAFVPVRRVYMVTNVTSLVRVDGGVSIPCFGFSLSLDVDSWAWGFSATLPADVLALIEPTVAGDPVELAATVNGVEFRLIAESLSRERVFGQAGVRVQGRGKTAVLDAPYSALQTFSEVDALTSQQLLDQSLPVGWTAAWGLTAWLVPGGTWSHQGTPISAANAIAAAGGGYLQPHASASSISILPRYPVAPWDWGTVTPDIEVPATVMVREAIEWVEKPRYNRVYVSGTDSNGKLVRVTRTGSAGDVVAQMVSDALITHGDAGRQRGLQVLADTGRQAKVTLRLPVLPETNVIRPGQFVRYVDGATVRLGLVRGVNVDVSFPEVWQTITVETHVS